MSQDDRAFAQQLLRVILGNPQLQASIGLSHELVPLIDASKIWKQLKQSARKQSLLSCRTKASKAGVSSR